MMKLPLWLLISCVILLAACDESNGMVPKWSKTFGRGLYSRTLAGNPNQFVFAGGVHGAFMKVAPIKSGGSIAWETDFPYEDSNIYQIPKSQRVVICMVSRPSGRNYKSAVEVWEMKPRSSEMHRVSQFKAKEHREWRVMCISGDGNYMVIDEIHELNTTGQIEYSLIMFNLENNTIQYEIKDLSPQHLSHKGMRLLAKQHSTWNDLVLDLEKGGLMWHAAGIQSHGTNTLSYDYMVRSENDVYCVYKWDGYLYQKVATLEKPQGNYLPHSAEISPDQRTLVITYSLSYGSSPSRWFIVNCHDLTKPHIPQLWSYQSVPTQGVTKMRDHSAWAANNDLFVRGIDKARVHEGPIWNIYVFSRKTGGLVAGGQVNGDVQDCHWVPVKGEMGKYHLGCVYSTDTGMGLAVYRYSQGIGLQQENAMM